MNFLPISHIRAARMTMLQLVGQSRDSKKIPPKAGGEDLWGHPVQPHQPYEHHSALQCCLCMSPPRSAGSGLCPTPKISSEKPEIPVCQWKKARGNKTSHLSQAHTVGGLYRLKIPVGAKTHCQASDRTSLSLVIIPPGIFAELSRKQFLISLLTPLPEMQSFGNSQVPSQFPGTRGKVSAVQSLTGACRVLTASPNPTVQPWSPSSCTCSTW